ncbi:hypothetical protein BG011_006387 [Mortierella polycephala]|uniref:Uncharacterized protein n=1 Tax=Mortierella polycephala TaxID=41804 RepID=A0A9P6PSZ2_9FUNG|nr:hypothetical protein BG011_006387 [Mortierella polycephala]
MMVNKNAQFKETVDELVNIDLRDDDDNVISNNSNDDTRNITTKSSKIMINRPKAMFVESDPEPMDSNSMEPMGPIRPIMSPPTSMHTAATATTTTAVPVAQPKPLHINTSLHHQQRPITSSAARTPTSASLLIPASSTIFAISDDTSISNYSPSTTTAAISPCLPPNGTTGVNYLDDSPDINVSIEMDRFGSHEADRRRSVSQDHKKIQTPHNAITPSSSSSSSTSSFFSGWMAIPPSLAGRPRLTEAQEAYVRREYERGPVPLMWPKESDLENQRQINENGNSQERHPEQNDDSSDTEAAPKSLGWFGSWGLGGGVKTANTADTTTRSMRREGSMAQ